MKLSNSTTKTLTFLTFLFLQQILMAQDVQREIGIRTSSFQNFTAVYKWQNDVNKYGRLTAAFIGLGLNTGSNSDSYNAGFGVTLGNEHRRSLADRTDFIHGLQYLVQAAFSTNENSSSFQSLAGISYLIGVQYHASDKFNVGIEFLPSLIVRYSETQTQRLSIDANASFSNAALFATYRFSSPGKGSRK